MRIKRKFVHNLSDAEVRSIFTDEMKRHGLIFDGKDLPLIMDGRTRYVKVENRSRSKKNARSGWYSGHMGDFPNGRFGWLHGENPLYTWSLYQHLKDRNGSVEFVELTEEQIEANRKQREREERQRQEQEKQRYLFSKAYTIVEWTRALDLKPHPYTNKKGFSIEECQDHVRVLNPNPYSAQELREILEIHFPEYNKPANIRKLIDYQSENITYRGFNLLIKGQTLTEDAIMLQMIFDKKSKSGKDKHFPKDLIKQNAFLNIGAKIDHTSTEVIICEGWATGISLVRITQKTIPILVAWDSGNMTSVAIEVRRAFTNIKIYSANDNDHTKPIEKNAGVRGGLKTCRAVAAYLLSPPFDSTNPNNDNLSDWNDIDNTHTPEQTTEIFYNEYLNASLHPAVYDPTSLLLSNESAYALDSEDVELQSGVKWLVHFTTLARLICRGIQNCRYSDEEQIEQYVKGFIQVHKYFVSNQLDKIHRTYDVEVDIEITDLMHDFVVYLHTSETHIMHDLKPISLLLKQLKRIQAKVVDINVLNALRDAITEKYSLETANLCIPYHLSLNYYFARSTKQWHQDLASELSCTYEDLDPLIITPLVINSKEVKYWEFVSGKERLNQASTEIYDLYKLHSTIQISDKNFAEQIERIRYLQNCINDDLLNQTEHSYNFMLRVLNRLNDIYALSISADQLIA